jgi:hypothetical protein
MTGIFAERKPLQSSRSMEITVQMEMSIHHLLEKEDKIIFLKEE